MKKGSKCSLYYTSASTFQSRSDCVWVYTCLCCVQFATVTWAVYCGGPLSNSAAYWQRSAAKFYAGLSRYWWRHAGRDVTRTCCRPGHTSTTSARLVHIIPHAPRAVHSLLVSNFWPHCVTSGLLLPRHAVTKATFLPPGTLHLLPVNFPVFCPIGATRCTDKHKIWYGEGHRRQSFAMPYFLPIG